MARKCIKADSKNKVFAQYKSVKTFFIIYVVVVVILFLPIKVKGKFSYRLTQNEGYLSLYLFNLRLLLYKTTIVPFKFVMSNGKKKLVFDFAFTGSNNFMEIFIAKIFGIIQVNNFNLYVNLGLFDPFSTSLSCAFLDAIALSTLSALSTKKYFHNYSVRFMPSYNEFNCTLASSFSCSINLFCIIYTFFATLFILLSSKKKQAKNNK